MASDDRLIFDRHDIDMSSHQVQQRLHSADRFSESDHKEKPIESARYRFLEQIGRGAYGDVWRVENKVGRRSLAVKVLRESLVDDPNAGTRLLREVLLTGRLRHPGIPPGKDHGVLDNGTTFYVMKKLKGLGNRIFNMRDPSIHRVILDEQTQRSRELDPSDRTDQAARAN